MTDNLTVEIVVESGLKPADKSKLKPIRPKGRVPRVSRIMALAVRMDQLIEDGVVADYAEVARLGHVSRTRVTHIMSLLHLAPDIQEELLFLPRVIEGRDPVRERMVRSIAAEVDWKRQRKMWRKLKANGPKASLYCKRNNM